ncbi:hypothetical protein [Stenotrophomonas geniculata]|uniref:hypothetical protein n=1 Tax=Stenotrophomonas geniculata TaxID=86188 RepID=UPI002478E8DC|nr:hypothetical protein [Stenotrophomonas geniculata]MDH7550183.1 hypothetical protein [Stenotrophomonas geniculata]
MVLGTLLFVGVGIAALFFTGALLNLLLWLSSRGASWLLLASIAYVVFSLIVLLPLAAFRGTRRFAGGGMTVGKGLLGFTLWVLCIALTFAKWGKTVTIVGLLFFGVGILPMGVVAGFLTEPWYGGFVPVLLIAAYVGASAAANHFLED